MEGNKIELSPIQECVRSMVGIFNELEDAKQRAAIACDAAYIQYCSTVKFGDKPPTQRAIEKLAKAMAAKKQEKFADDLKDLAQALLQTIGEPTLPGM